MTDQLLWTPEQVAERLQLSRNHVYRLVQTKRIPFSRFGNRLRFRPADIEQWLEAKTVSAVK
jgi:excisionase family DNA binding protein